MSLTLPLRAGEIVSCGYGFGVVITGRVIQLHRKSDGKPFLMVEITAHPDPARVGTREYLEQWELGVGDREGVCERCRRPYRWSSTEPPELPSTCAGCARLDNASGQAADPSRRSTSWERRQRRWKDAS